MASPVMTWGRLPTVMAMGMPVENAAVAFGIHATLGMLKISEDRMLDDGSAPVRPAMNPSLEWRA